MRLVFKETKHRLNALSLRIEAHFFRSQTFFHAELIRRCVVLQKKLVDLL